MSKPTLCRRVGAKDWNEFSSAKAAALACGVSKADVIQCCARVGQTKGFEFTYAASDVLDGEEWRDVILTPGSSHG